MAISENAVVTAFNLADGVKAQRKMMKTFFNAGTSAAPIWEVLGKGVEDSSIEFSPQKTTTTDILGITTATVDSLEMTQTLEPMTIVGGSKLQVQLIDILARSALTEFETFEVMIVREYITIGSGVYAEVHKGCTINPTGEGGSSTDDLPVEITFSDNKTLGSVVYSAEGIPTFTATVATP